MTRHVLAGWAFEQGQCLTWLSFCRCCPATPSTTWWGPPQFTKCWCSGNCPSDGLGMVRTSHSPTPLEATPSSRLPGLGFRPGQRLVPGACGGHSPLSPQLQVLTPAELLQQWGDPPPKHTGKLAGTDRTGHPRVLRPDGDSMPTCPGPGAAPLPAGFTLIMRIQPPSSCTVPSVSLSTSCGVGIEKSAEITQADSPRGAKVGGWEQGWGKGRRLIET